MYRFVFTSTHGQDQIKKGLVSIKDTLVVNLEQTLLKGQKMVSDHMMSANYKVALMTISK